MSHKVTAIIVAAGSGKRFGGQVKKQFMEINGKPVLRYTLERFQTCDKIDDISVVVPQESIQWLTSEIPDRWGISKVKNIISGGSDRQDSVWAALKELDDDVEIVAVHDGVRPFIASAMIAKLVDAAGKYGAALVGVKPKDTIKLTREAVVIETLDRRSLVSVQTPQVFTRELLVKAYQKAQLDEYKSTDDSALVENLGEKVIVLEGSYQNIKITSPEDVLIAEAFLNRNANK
ncbi:MAG: 2-C-methyl-D-erythritol 4-phosphate cytidylyltransferase [Actinobacteria bacterium]|nr:2-C-methyl-D-erythritol 4-phosphate cytidylyltransferase [Actinomycetota bacterium]